MMSSLLLKPTMNITLRDFFHKGYWRGEGDGTILKDKVKRTVRAFDCSGFAMAVAAENLNKKTKPPARLCTSFWSCRGPFSFYVNYFFLVCFFCGYRYVK